MNDTLLIVEDNQQNFHMMQFLLENNGFPVIETVNGLEGIEKPIDPDTFVDDIRENLRDQKMETNK
jgi:CheY-like chemotaxis protein